MTSRRIVIVVGTDRTPSSGSWTGPTSDNGARRQGADRYGQSAAPAVAEGRAFLAPAELREQLADADVVITAGPGTISDARRSGHRPIVACPATRAG
ncbi:MAG: hypothetical protein R2734_14600 [Nocardioides sp.]